MKVSFAPRSVPAKLGLDKATLIESDGSIGKTSMEWAMVRFSRGAHATDDPRSVQFDFLDGTL
jgi:hypothetical protein